MGFWMLGALCIFFGALIAGSVDASTLGSTTLSILIAYIISFVMILLGGMFWISAGVTGE